MTLAVLPVAVDPHVPAATESRWSLDVLGEPAFAVVVYGDPAPQGSKRVQGSFRRTRKDGQTVQVPNLVESSKERVDRWRGDVVNACQHALPAGWRRLADDKYGRTGVVLDLVFTRNLPMSAPKRARVWPGTQPDLDKLARSTGDALKTAGVYRDDSRVVAYRRLEKVYVGSGDPDALPTPGAVIRVWDLARVVC